MVLAQFRTCVYKNESLGILSYPPNFNIRLILDFVCSWVDSLISLLMLIYEYHAFTYIPVQHWHIHIVNTSISVTYPILEEIYVEAYKNLKPLNLLKM